MSIVGAKIKQLKWCKICTKMCFQEKK